jgi:hypothetical protein
MSVQRVFLMVIITSSFWLHCQAQYRVIIAQGRTYVDSKNTFHQLEVGEILDDSVSLNLVDNAELALLDEAGRFLVLNKTGTYDLSKVNLKESDNASKIIHDIWTNHFENVATNRSIGSAEEVNSSAFELYLPSSSEAYGFELFLKWTDVSDGNYRIELLDEFENVFREINTTKAKYKLDLLSKDLAWKRQVFIRVTDLKNNRNTGLTAVAKLSPPDLDDANSTSRLFLQGEDEVAILTKAAFFEQKGWIADVHGLLFEAAKKNEIIKTYYISFLERNGFFGLINEVRK